MITQSKSHRYVSNRRGWRGGKRSVKHQAECIVDSMLAHGRDMAHYEPMNDELRAAVEAELERRGELPARSIHPDTSQEVSANSNVPRTQPVDNDLLADIVVHIVRATMRKGGDPKLAIQPYSNAVRKLVATKLTHSECLACELIPQDSEDFVEKYLRSAAKKVENKRYAAIGYLSLA